MKKSKLFFVSVVFFIFSCFSMVSYSFGCTLKMWCSECGVEYTKDSSDNSICGPGPATCVDGDCSQGGTIYCNDGKHYTYFCAC